jgi:hypothetical protein
MVEPAATEPAASGDPRWETGMPVLDRQAVREPSLPPSLRALAPRSVPELRPTPLLRHYVSLSVIALVCGAFVITALELGVPLGSPLVKVCVALGAPILFLTTADAGLRIWRSAWAWMPVDAGRGSFRLAWFGATVVLLLLLAAATWVVLTA